MLRSYVRWGTSLSFSYILDARRAHDNNTSAHAREQTALDGLSVHSTDAHLQPRYAHVQRGVSVSPFFHHLSSVALSSVCVCVPRIIMTHRRATQTPSTQSRQRSSVALRGQKNVSVRRQSSSSLGARGRELPRRPSCLSEQSTSPGVGSSVLAYHSSSGRSRSCVASPVVRENFHLMGCSAFSEYTVFAIVFIVPRFSRHALFPIHKYGFTKMASYLFIHTRNTQHPPVPRLWICLRVNGRKPLQFHRS